MLRYTMCVLTLFSAVASAQEAGKSADEIAAQLANPNAVLGKMTFNLDYTAYQGDLPGAGSQNAVRLAFQPSLPYPRANGTNFFLRPFVPLIIRQDVPTANGYDSKGVELGDIGFDAAIGKTFPTGTIMIAGVVGTLPTATDDALGKDQWMLGPEFFVGRASRKGVIGVLLTHQWDIAGEDSFDTSITGGQYFLTWNFRNAWQFSTAPSFSYDHEAASGQRLTFPLGIGVAKTQILNGRPWRFAVEYWHYVEQADAFGPDWQIRFVASPVVQLPWGK